MTAFLEFFSPLRLLIFAYTLVKAEALARSMAYTLSLYNCDIPVVRDFLPDKDQTVDHAS